MINRFTQIIWWKLLLLYLLYGRFIAICSVHLSVRHSDKVIIPIWIKLGELFGGWVRTCDIDFIFLFNPSRFKVIAQSFSLKIHWKRINNCNGLKFSYRLLIIIATPHRCPQNQYVALSRPYNPILHWDYQCVVIACLHSSYISVIWKNL